jgi:hypothetical protein
VIRHTHHQLTLLKDSLLLHRYADAAEIMKGLVHALNICPDIVRRAGIAVLRQSTDTYSECVQYFRNLLAKKSIRQREVLLFELTLFMVSNGNIEDAVDLLSSYLQSDPFKSNKLLQSYAGLFNYVLWKRGPPQERKIKSEEFSLEQMEEDRLFQDEEDMELNVGTQSTPSGGDRHSTAALQHWRSVVDVEEGEHTWHPFIREHTELLVHLGHNEEAHRLIMTMASQNSEDIISQRTALQYLKQHRPFDEKNRMKVLRTISGFDPSCKEVLELADMLKKGSEADVEEGETLLKTYFEYPQNMFHSFQT